jgi:hypothetical protein
MTITRRLGVTILGLATLVGCQAPVNQPPLGDAAAPAEVQQPAGERSLQQVTRDFTRQPPPSTMIRDHQRLQVARHHRGHTRHSHRLFGRVGDVFAGSVFPFVSTRFASPALFYTDLLGARLYGLPGIGELGAARLSRGGRFVVFVQNGELGLYDLRTHLIRTFPAVRGAGLDPWNVDVDVLGNITYLDAIGRVHVYDTDSGQDFIVPTAGRTFSRLNPLSLSGDGRFLAVAGTRDLLLTDLTSNRQVTLPFAGRPLHRGEAFALSQDGRCLLFQTGTQLRLMDTRTGQIDPLIGLNVGAGMAASPLGFGRQIRDAQFLDGGCSRIAFERAGTVQVFDRRTGQITPMSFTQGTRDISELSRLQGLQWGPLTR